MALVAKLRGEPIENGDRINDVRGRPWTFRMVSRDGKLFVIPAKGEGAWTQPEHFPDLTVEECSA